MTIVVVLVAWAVVEVTKLRWHGYEPYRAEVAAFHAAGVAVLAAHLHPWAAILATVSVLASYATLEDKRRNGILGSTMSGLSSYPWQAAAVLALAIDLSWPAGLLAVPIGGVFAWIGGLPWVSRLRPTHWAPSKQRWAYPAGLRRRLGEPKGTV